MDILCEKVIRALLDVDGYITTSEIADIVGISTSNIKHNISTIKEELNKFDVSLDSIPKKGLYFSITSDQKKLITKALNESVSKNSEFYIYRKNYILDTLFFYNINYTIQLFADELFVSKNTIQRDIEQINKENLQFGIKIKPIRNLGLTLKGDECNIRQAIIENNNSKYWNFDKGGLDGDYSGWDKRMSIKACAYITHTYSLKNIRKIQKLLQNCENSINVYFNDISFCRLLEYLEIASRRVSMGKIIRKSFATAEFFPQHIKYLECANELLCKLLPANKKGYAYEAEFLAARLFISETKDDSNICIGNEYDEICAKYLERIETIFSEHKLSPSTILVRKMALLIARIKVRESYHILDWNDINLDVRSELPGLYGMCLTHINILSDSLNCRFTQDDVALITILINNAIMSLDNKISAIFLHAADYETAKYQVSKMHKQIPELMITERVFFMDYVEGNYNDCLVISTLRSDIDSPNVISVTKHIDDEDIAVIRDDLRSAQDSIKHKRDAKLINEIFSEKLIIPRLQARTMEEAVTKMSRCLLEKNYVSDGFLENVLKRENFCTTVIGNKIAIPHAYKQYVNENKIVIAKLKHSIEWGAADKVNLVFLLAIKYDESVKINFLFKYLYSLFEDKESIEALRATDSPAEIYKIVTNLKD